MCLIMCLFKSLFDINSDPHKLHLKGFSSECLIMCLFKSLFDRKDTWWDTQPFKCSLCEAGFISNRDFKCSLCGSEFISNSDLKRHMMTHPDEKPFKCSVCEAGFISNSDFKSSLTQTTFKRLLSIVCHHVFFQATTFCKTCPTFTAKRAFHQYVSSRVFSSYYWLYIQTHKNYI